MTLKFLGRATNLSSFFCIVSVKYYYYINVRLVKIYETVFIFPYSTVQTKMCVEKTNYN